MAGGAFGNIQSYKKQQVGGSLDISSCYSAGKTTAKSFYYACNAGGFAGQLYTTVNAYITDCYSSSDTAEEYTSKGNLYFDPCAGGFVGYLKGTSTATNCYSANIKYSGISTSGHAAFFARKGTNSQVANCFRTGKGGDEFQY